MSITFCLQTASFAGWILTWTQSQSDFSELEGQELIERLHACLEKELEMLGANDAQVQETKFIGCTNLSDTLGSSGMSLATSFGQATCTLFPI